MITVKPFQALRPQKGFEQKVSCAPYDVMDEAQARAMAKGNDDSYLHITRSEIDLPQGTDPYHQKVYERAKENLDRFLDEGILAEDSKKCYYLYREVMHGRAQTGVVGCASIDDYEAQKIKRHEFTRLDKEIDRINHFYACNANTEPVFLFYKKNRELDVLVKNWITQHEPLYDFVAEDHVRHMLWLVDEDQTIASMENAFAAIDSLYIADGHHRTACAVKVGLRKREENLGYTGQEEFNFFLSVLFPEEELYIMAYNRVVEDLAGMTQEEFLKGVQEKFTVTPCPHFEEPTQRSTFTMVLGDKSYRLVPREGTYDKNDPVARLDVAILQNNLLSPLLKIQDPRTDQRISFYGGETMKEEIAAKMKSGSAVAFLLYPTQISDIINVSDAGEVMPPKSTWFEPKLRSGLFIHRL